MDPKQSQSHQQSTTPAAASAAAAAKKTPTGIPTGIPRSSGIPAPAVRRSAAPNEQQSSGSTEEIAKLHQSSSQKSLSAASASSASASGGNQIVKQSPSASTIPIPTSSSSSSLSSSHEAIGLKAASSTTASTSQAGATAADNEQVDSLKNQVKDLSEKLETLKLKRAEDREKIREVDKLKLQNQQLNEFKTKAQEIISSLNKELQQSKSELSNMREQYETYKEAMSSHEQRLEEMTVDKELAEAKAEELQDEINKLSERNEEIKLELEVLKGEIEVSGVEGAAGTYRNKQAEKEIENLKAALIKLRDLNVSDKSEIGRLKKQCDECVQKMTKLQKENDQLRAESAEQQAQINDLNDQVTATLGSVQMIEQLTEQNLDLEEKLAEARETIVDLEAINDVNDQLQENAREEERELRRTLDMSEARVRESERQIELLKYTLADHERTIVKFRELVKQLQDEKDLVTRKLRSKLEEKSEQTNKQEGQSSTTFDFKQKFIETQHLAIQIENELHRIELSSNRKYISNLLSFFPDNFIKQSGQNECILSLLFFKRISSKCEFLLSHFKDKISHEFSGPNEDKPPQQPATSQMEFFYNISMYSALIKLVSNKFDHVLNNCDVKTYNNIGSMYYDFNLNEKNLDALFELMQKDQLDETLNLDNLEKTFIHFDTIYKNHLFGEKFDHLTYLDDFINAAQISADTIGIVFKRIEKLNGNSKDETAEIVLLFKEVACKNDENKQSLKKLQRHLKKDEKIANRMSIDFPSDLVVELEKSLNSYFLLVKTLKELYMLISTYKTVSANDYSDVIPSKQIEELAFQACDKVYLKDDNGPYENLRNSTKQIRSSIERLVQSLESGEYEKKLSEDEFKIKKYQVNCPILKCAEDYKNTLIEAENIKYKLEAKDEEIKELKKTLKMKSDELSEQKVRISLVEKKGETQTKEMEEKNKSLTKSIQDLKDELAKKEKEQSDTVEALQQELDTLQNERRDLKEKLRNTNKKIMFDSLINRRSGGGGGASENVDYLSSSPSDRSISGQMGTADTYPLIYELNLMRNVNRLLQKNITEVNQKYAMAICNKFSSLPKLSERKQGKTELDNLASMYRQSNGLMVDLLNSFGNVRVENLKNKSRSNENKKNNISILMIRSKIASLESSLSSLKQQVSKRKLVAEISLPRIERSNVDAKTVDLNLNLDDIKELLRKI